jgi:hypothetical protein
MRKNIMSIMSAFALAALLAVGVTGCKEEDSALENAVEETEEAAEDAAEETEEAMEDLGEDLEDIGD